MQPKVDVRNSEPGGFSAELALGQKKRNQPLLGIARDEFVPYETLYELWRQSTGGGVCVSEGELSSINLNKDRDTVLITGQDWIAHLQRRIYPFNPELYMNGDWVRWPRTWPDVKGTHGPAQSDNPVDVSIIVRQLIQSIRYEPPTGEPPIATTWPSGAAETLGAMAFSHNIPVTGHTTKYQIYPGDPTFIYDHIRKLSEMTEAGFEFDITPLSREFRLWSPRRDNQQIAMYTIAPSDLEADGPVLEFDWTNEGPDATYLVGLAAGKHKVGAVWTDIDSVERFGRHDKSYDFGELQNPDMVLQLLQDQNDIHPQKKLNLVLLNPEFLPLNFYTGGRPRNLIGARIFVNHDFAPLHEVHAYFRINAINWDIDKSTNESVGLELEMVYEP